MNCTDFAASQGSPKNGCNFQLQIYKVFRKILQHQLLKGEYQQIKAKASNSKIFCVSTAMRILERLGIQTSSLASVRLWKFKDGGS